MIQPVHTESLANEKDTVPMGIVAQGVPVCGAEVKYHLTLMVEEGCARGHN